MVTFLGEHEGIRFFYDSEMGEMNIAAGSSKKRKLPSGKVHVPLNEYKESLNKEPNIFENEDFRLPTEKDFKKEVKVTWVIGGSDEIEVYKKAVDYIKSKFTLI